MVFPPAVIVHGLADARAAVAIGLPVTLLSAPGAGLYAGCLWWRGIVERVRRSMAAGNSASHGASDPTVLTELLPSPQPLPARRRGDFDLCSQGQPDTRADTGPRAIVDILDCADGAGQAMAALRAGVHNLVLWPDAPGWEAVAEVAASLGGCVLTKAPPALDLAQRGAARRLDAWLSGAGLRDSALIQ